MKKLPKLKLRFPKKLVPKTKRSKIVILAVILILLASIAVAVFIIKKDQGSSTDKEVTQKIEKMDQKKDLTCEEVVGEVGDISSDGVKDAEIKKELLERQMACLADQQKFEAAIQSAEKLKGIYSSQADERAVKRVDRRIEDMKEAKTYQETEANQSNDSSQQ